MATHVWERTGDGTAHYCAQCRMRVDDDEFGTDVEDSLCVPYVPEIAEHVEALPPPPAAADHIDITEAMTLEGFAQVMGYELSPWQVQVLRTFDAEIRRKRTARGLSN